MYKLCRPTTCILKKNGEKPVALTIPANALIEMNGEIPAEGMIEVSWDNQKVSVFAIDLKERGEVVNCVNDSRNTLRAGMPMKPLI
jgi:hypothetical protein